MKEIYSAQQQPLYIAHSEEESKEKEEKEMQVGGAKVAPNDQEEKDVGDGFGGNLDGADQDARDDEDEEEGENNQGGDGFGGNLDGAVRDARDDVDEDFRDDPNFSIDVEQLLSKWEEEEKHEAKKRRKT